MDSHCLWDTYHITMYGSLSAFGKWNNLGKWYALGYEMSLQNVEIRQFRWNVSKLQVVGYSKGGHGSIFEKPKDTSVIAFIISVTEMDMRKEIVEVLLESGEVLEMDEAAWQLFDEELKKGKIEVKIDTVQVPPECRG
eukprot:superscaffoldBa00001319_g10042